jgi:hypothetical protein
MQRHERGKALMKPAPARHGGSRLMLAARYPEIVELLAEI